MKNKRLKSHEKRRTRRIVDNIFAVVGVYSLGYSSSMNSPYPTLCCEIKKISQQRNFFGCIKERDFLYGEYGEFTDPVRVYIKNYEKNLDKAVQKIRSEFAKDSGVVINDTWLNAFRVLIKEYVEHGKNIEALIGGE